MTSFASFGRRAINSAFHCATDARYSSFPPRVAVEVLSAAAVAWQFTRRDPERFEAPTLRVIALAFFALAAYTVVSAAPALFGVSGPEPSLVGIVLASASVVIMPALSLLERRTGRELGSATVVADSKQTLICSLLSAAVLLGLLANGLLGWWWAVAVVALVIGALIVPRTTRLMRKSVDVRHESVPRGIELRSGTGIRRLHAVGRGRRPLRCGGARYRSAQTALQPLAVLPFVHDGEHLDDLMLVVDAVPDQVREDLQCGSPGIPAEDAERKRGLPDRGDRRGEVVSEPIDLLRRVEGLPVLGAFGIAFRGVAEQDGVAHRMRLRSDASTSSHNRPTRGSASASVSRWSMRAASAGETGSTSASMEAQSSLISSTRSATPSRFAWERSA